jgi:Sec-independent protein translocase protein TatA
MSAGTLYSDLPGGGDVQIHHLAAGPLRIDSDMLNLDPGKLLVIGVVAILVLGPDRLPRVAKQVGAAWRSFSEFRHRMESQMREQLPDLPSTEDLARLTRSPSALLNHLSSMGTETAADTGTDTHTRTGPGAAVGEMTDQEPMVVAVPATPLVSVAPTFPPSLTGGLDANLN